MPDPSPHLILVIDPVLGCNLRCPSCPSALRTHARSGGGILSAEKLDTILDKLGAEVPGLKIHTWMYNWTEPFLHPHLDELVRIAKNKTSYVGLSSNLNIKKTDIIERTLLAGPSALKISVSGYSQKVYARNHTGGDIELVKSNLMFIRDVINRHDLKKTKIWVGYHVYKDNGEEEFSQMEAFCQQLGFPIEPYLAYLCPLEWVLDILEDRKEIPAGIAATTKRLPLHPGEGMRLIGEFLPYERACSWHENMLVLDAEGNVDLCCRTFEQQLGVNFLETPLSSIRELQDKHPFCDRCRAARGHQYERLAMIPAVKERWAKILKDALENRQDVA